MEGCERPHWFLVVTRHERASHDVVIEATLSADGDQSILIAEWRGLPLDHIAAYGAGNQIHVEDLADCIAGRERRDPGVRWDELELAYRELADDVS